MSHLEININKYNPLKAGSYLPLPISIRSTKSCLNIHNFDEHCFLWCIAARMYPAKINSSRVTSYPHYSLLFDTTNMTFPPGIEDIKVFEKNNPNISINVYGLEKNNTVTGPLYATLARKITHVNLLYITKNGKAHFCLIKDFARLVRRQLTKHKSKIYLCDECLSYFTHEEKLLNHDCSRIHTVLPEDGSKLHFSNYERTQRIPIVIYGDFESLLCKYSNENKSLYTENIQNHEPSCFAYYICCQSKPELNDFVSYRGPDCGKKFVESITHDVKRLHALLNSSNPMLPLTSEQLALYNEAKVCCICKKMFKKTIKK